MFWRQATSCCVTWALPCQKAGPVTALFSFPKNSTTRNNLVWLKSIQVRLFLKRQKRGECDLISYLLKKIVRSCKGEGLDRAVKHGLKTYLIVYKITRDQTDARKGRFT